MFFVLPVLLYAGSAFAMVTGETKTPDKVIKQQQFWGISLDFGLGYASGNSRYLQTETGFTTFINPGRSSIYFDGKVSYRESNYQKNVNNSYLTTRYDYHLTPRWGIMLMDTVGHDQFTKVDLKVSNSVGLLYDYRYKEDKFRNGTSIAVSYLYEEGSIGIIIRQIRLPLRNELNLRFNDFVSFYVDFYYIPVVNDFKDFAIKLKPRLESKITEILYAFISLSMYHDSKPLPGVKRNDVLVSSGITLRI